MRDDDMEDSEGLAGTIDFESGGGPDTMDGCDDDEKSSAPFSTNDAWADFIMNLYRQFQSDSMFAVKVGACMAGPISILLFALFVSNAASTLVAFVTFVVSIMFVGFSLHMLGWILDKDIGPRSMQEIAEPIKEGSEGFFEFCEDLILCFF